MEKTDNYQTEASQWYEQGYKIKGEMIIPYQDDRHEQNYKEGTPVHYLTLLRENASNSSVCHWIKHYFGLKD